MPSVECALHSSSDIPRAKTLLYVNEVPRINDESWKKAGMDLHSSDTVGYCTDNENRGNIPLAHSLDSPADSDPLSLYCNGQLQTACWRCEYKMVLAFEISCSNSSEDYARQRHT